MANLDLTLIGKVNPGTNPQSSGMTFQTNAPLDDRCAVRNKASLISESAFGSNTYMYPGMAVSVVKSGEMYILINPDPTTITLYTDAQIGERFKTDEALDAEIVKHWKKLASSSDISGLSGVFTFKGVAEAINQDQSIITTRKVITTAVTDENGKVITPSEPLYCITTAYEFDTDVYYGWGTSLEDIRFWTDTTTVNSSILQYDKGAQMDVTAYEFKDKLYYPTGTEYEYESIDGEVVYIKNKKVYETEDFTKTSIGDATEVTYTGYAFTEKTPKIILNKNTTSKTIAASPDNSGHVYQIGENEYASNGQIWVKLGSPVEDWIII